jgi:hypothetical protein
MNDREWKGRRRSREEAEKQKQPTTRNSLHRCEAKHKGGGGEKRNEQLKGSSGRSGAKGGCWRFRAEQGTFKEVQLEEARISAGFWFCSATPNTRTTRRLALLVQLASRVDHAAALPDQVFSCGSIRS